MFAVERIRSLTITDHPYQLPLGFEGSSCGNAHAGKRWLWRVSGRP